MCWGRVLDMRMCFAFVVGITDGSLFFCAADVLPPSSPPPPPGTRPSIASIRLVGGASAAEGRVEVQIAGRWGTVSAGSGAVLPRRC